ncbi:acyltransferase family protein [Phytobacter ursingii]|uniref:acyltransferase family protein n=1 Tax=Phytobacter ursingii TaxID=1972431 RepID=UPI000CD0C5AA|nr:hypothetical protein C2U51_07300 [Enterobacteriaceae bacterium ENNIH1]
MKKKTLWINQIKGLCICLVVIYHSVITFYPHLTTFSHAWSETLAKCWIYFNLYLAPFRMPVFFFLSGYLIRRYIDEVPWKETIDKRIWSIFYVLVLWGVLQWLALSHINDWLAPARDLRGASNAAYADTPSAFINGMLTASTSLWYLYALVVYFILCKLLSRWALAALAVMAFLSVAINFLPSPWWGMNSVLRNMIYYSMGAWFGGAIMDAMTRFSFRRYVVWLAGALLAAVALWFLNVPLPLSLLSVVLILRLFHALEARVGSGENAVLNIVGSNTLAIYTTHRILIEALSLALLTPMNAGRWSPAVELTIVLLYPFCSLVICTLVGLCIRKISSAIFADLFFTPPAKLAPPLQTR